MAKKPTIGEIKALRTTLVDDHASLRSEQKIDDDFYEGVDDVGIKEPYHTVRTGLGRAMVDVPADHIVTSHPVAVVEPRKLGEKYEKQADTLQKFYQGWLDYIAQESPNPLTEANKKLWVRGESFFKVVYDPGPWGEEHEKREGESRADFDARREQWELDCLDHFPLILQSPDPMTLYTPVAHDRGRPKYAFQVYMKTVEELEESLESHRWRWANTKHLKSSSSVEWAECWFADWRCFLADGQPVLPGEVQRNILSFVPFVHMYSGLGLTSPLGERERLARSVLYPARSLLTTEQRGFSQLDSIISQWAYPKVRVRNREMGVEVDMAEVKAQLSTGMAPAGIIDESKYEVIFEPGTPPPPALFQHILNLSGMLQQMGSVAVLRGVPPAGISAGYPMALLVGQARLKYGEGMRSLTAGLSRALGMGAMIVERVMRQALTLRTEVTEGRTARRIEHTIKPEDINGYYQVKVKLESEAPEARDARIMLGLRLRQAGEISQETALEDFYGIQGAYDEMVRIAAEKLVQQNPVLQQARAVRALKTMGLEKELAELEAQGEKPALAGPEGVASPVPEGPLEAERVRKLQRLGPPEGVAELGSRPETEGGMHG